MKNKTIQEFADLLEEAGYDGALLLIKNDLIPLARKKHISLASVASEYADQDAEQDTSWFQLFSALNRIPHEKLEKLNIHKPL